MVNYIWKRWV